MQKKISVIIPVYNGEKHVARCIDSVLNQHNFHIDELEILLLNDGSKDGSLKILEKYASKYPKIITVITHKNMGVAKTRDKGTSIATGKYIMFIDQDDYIDSDYCAKLYGETKTKDHDIIICGLKRPGAGRRIINKHIKLKDTPYAKYVCTGVFPKLHKTSFIRENKIQAFHTVYGEDIGFVLHEYLKTKKIKVIQNYAGYNWFYNESSVSNTLHKRMLDVLPMHLTMLDKIKSYDTGTPEHEYYVLQTIVAYLLWAGRSAKNNEFNSAYKKVFTWLYRNYPNINQNKYIVFGPSPASGLTRFSISVFMLLHRFRLVPLFARVYCRGH